MSDLWAALTEPRISLAWALVYIVVIGPLLNRTAAPMGRATYRAIKRRWPKEDTDVSR